MRRLILALTAVFIAFAASAAQRSDWNQPPKEKIAGLEHHTFRSASMRTDVGYNICLPPEYSREPKRRFPVIYYLHGYEGNESSFLDYVKLWRESLARTGPTILVLVNGGETSFFSDAPDGSVMGETVVVKELVPHIDEQFRTRAEQRARSLHGYSMGGFGALKLAFKHPEIFGSVVAYGATISDARDFQKHLGKVYKQMFGTPDRYEANNPLAMAERNADQIRGRVAILAVVGSKDEFVNANRELHQRLESRKVPHEYLELSGVKHAKEPLYERAAARAFEFSAKAFNAAVKSTKGENAKAKQ
ncbi:MAG TPA: alpha/beta hydrolase-fold protein [Candidatus Acidoferrum sp.]|nr:alpha/beta hydrolase-fold protein [Candidatus Acidoferrum sp.]